MTEEQLHIVQEINTSDLCSIISSRNSSLEDEIRRLKNENKLLGERCNQLLADKGKLTDELDKWKDEWNDQVIKANEEGFARTLQTIQLSKAKDLLAKWVELYKPKSDTALPTPIQVETEQFLNSELQSKWINPARTTNDNKIKLNSEVEK